LVTLGGGDPDNVTLKVIRALQYVEVTGLEANIVVGPNNPHLETLRKAVEQTDGYLRLMTGVADMPAVMAWADIALAAGGSTCWELAFMGLPSIVTVLAENQAASTQRLHEGGAALSLGRAPDCRPDDLARTLDGLIRDPQRRRLMSESGRALVDGRGAERVAAIIRGG
jgi:spore coat polysaccharide biosynthesis predicted glycosyltransferase SpsG